MIQCLHTTTLKHKRHLTFIFHTDNKNDSFLDVQETSFDQQNHPSSLLNHPHNSHKHKHQNRNEHLIANDGFSEDEDQQFFDHINHQNNDQSDDEGVGGPTTPLSPPLQYHQPRCPVDMNLDHLSHYIDRHHFLQQQHNV